MTSEEKVALVESEKERYGLNLALAAVELPKSTWYYHQNHKLSYEEIAATTGLKLGTVRSRINRGRKYFRKAVEPLLADDYRLKGNES